MKVFQAKSGQQSGLLAGQGLEEHGFYCIKLQITMYYGKYETWIKPLFIGQFAISQTLF